MLVSVACSSHFSALVRSARLVRALIIAAIVLGGCDGKKPQFVLDGSVSDGNVDGMTVLDASDGMVDAAPDADAMAPTVECVTGDVTDIVSMVGDAAESEIDLVAGAASALVVVRARLVDAFPGQQVLAFALSGDSVSAGAPLAVADTGTLRHPAVALRGSAYVAGWTDSLANSIPRATHARGVSTAGAALGTSPTRVTFNVIADDYLSLLPVPTGTLAVYRTGPTVSAAVFDDTHTITAGPTSIGTATGIEGRTVLARIGALPFVAYRAGTGRIRTASVAADASAGGAPNDVSMTTSTGTRFDFAGYEMNGAVVFEETISASRSEVHFREVDTAGVAMFAEPALSGDIAEGHAPSLGKIGGGYIVAYRHEEAATLILKLILIDHLGNIVSSADGPTLTSTDGDVRVRVANDGTPYVIFEEPTTVSTPSGDMPGTVLRYLRVTCS